MQQGAAIYKTERAMREPGDIVNSFTPAITPLLTIILKDFFTFTDSALEIWIVICGIEAIVLCF